MIDRISKNEERFDNIIKSINNLRTAINEFENNKKNISLVNKYYGSKNWFKDKESYEKGMIPKIKAGVLSEDAVWNMMDEINELMVELNNLSKGYIKK